MSILEKIHGHEDLIKLSPQELEQLCGEIRSFLVEHVSQTGGHLASNLGVVELTVALETVFDTATDRLVFDVGHQSYVHKILTGRREQFSSLRRFGGLAGFPKPSESATDAFVAGHASNSVSVALGLARARTAQGQNHHVLALIGDGATTGGLSFEGLNDAGASNLPLIVILNDNDMSISGNVGAISRHLSRIRTRSGYFGLKKAWRKFTNRIPGGKVLYSITHSFKKWLKNSMIGTTMFEEMGFNYIGPVDGHDLDRFMYLLQIAKTEEKPVLLHVITQKGRGYAPAEQNPTMFHGIGEFHPDSGEPVKGGGETFSGTFGKTLAALGEKNPKICAITAAMLPGTGLVPFAAAFPDRTFDVGIAEGHAVSMAGGLAKGGMVPVVAIYSTFLQRAYDMIFQDVAILGLHVVFAVDRAGLVGEDGETHHGLYDVGYLSQVPGMTILCPSSQAELVEMLTWAVEKCAGPVAVRYPRGGDGAYTGVSREMVFRPGTDVTILTYSTMINQVLEAAELLDQAGISAEVLRLAQIKPLDLAPIADSVRKTGRLLVVEEAAAEGSLGQQVIAGLAELGLDAQMDAVNTGDRFVTHGERKLLLQSLGLDAQSIANHVKEALHREK